MTAMIFTHFEAIESPKIEFLKFYKNKFFSKYMMLKSLFRAVSKKVLKENPDGRNDSRKNQKGFQRRES